MTNEELVYLIKSGHNEYMEQLYYQNRKFIYSIVKKFSFTTKLNDSYHYAAITEVDDLMQESYFGLHTAVMNYNPSKGYLFLTYAAYWIKQSIRRYIDNCGNVIRVPVHTQEKVYKYNSITSNFLQKYNRVPSRSEYMNYLGMSYYEVIKLENFMNNIRKVKSLDESIPGIEDDAANLSDTVPSSNNVEHDVVESVGNQQIKEELWSIVKEVIKDDRKYEVIKLRFQSDLSLEAIGDRYNITRENVRQIISKGLRAIRCNSRTKRIGKELGLLDGEPDRNIRNIKYWAEEGMLNILTPNELQYAKRMGWLKEIQCKQMCL
jgi:RNA polymerase sigma factor (sigma-70 family)